MIYKLNGVEVLYLCNGNAKCKGSNICGLITGICDDCHYTHASNIAKNKESVDKMWKFGELFEEILKDFEVLINTYGGDAVMIMKERMETDGSD